ncbi:putative toxin-antitoxin system toxin component, PIN family [Comamonadaceae bacterium M7527]|nr:putative toxin-antitoxin system toxin component, PIN family [Comamonadaceae bacterium M7527]
MTSAPQRWVIDTNTALDFLVFEDPRAQSFFNSLQSGQAQWWVCAPMRDELMRVLGYPLIAKRRAKRTLTVDAVMQVFDRLTHMVNVPAKAIYTCKDADDQVFIDLAVACQATLVSKDKAVLAMRGRLKKLGIQVVASLEPSKAI